jgi:hypothetical protein
MADQRIAQALADATDTRAVVVEAGALRSVDRVFAECFAGAAAIVVAHEAGLLEPCADALFAPGGFWS